MDDGIVDTVPEGSPRVSVEELVPQGHLMMVLYAMALRAAPTNATMP